MDFDARSSRFEDLYAAHSGEVYGYALRRGANRADAEDVVVETFLVCWRRLEKVPDPGLPWLLGVTRRVLANQRRGKRRYLALRDKISASLYRCSTLASDPPSQDPYDLKEALATLSDEDHDVLAL
ncbi:MAG: hypothetical protein JW820_18570, partial [Spirochaetales bacterium]|nr:hypothetical protein [Spirochaetales bacterium]